MATLIREDKDSTYYENFHCEIFTNLLLGSQDLVKKSRARDHLYNKLGVRYILNAAADVHGAKGDSRFNILQIDAIDVDGFDLSPAFQQSSSFIQQAIETETPIYIHCAEGVSRSVTLVLAYLILKHKMTLSNAFDLIKRKRPYAQPNMSFWQQLILLDYKIHGSVSCDCNAYIVTKLGYTQEIADRLMKDIKPLNMTLKPNEAAQEVSVTGTTPATTATTDTDTTPTTPTPTSSTKTTTHGANIATTHGAKMGPSKITDTGTLWLGAAPCGNPDTISLLLTEKVTHILNITKDAPFPDSINADNQFRLAIDDVPDADISSQLIDAIGFIQSAIDTGGKVYVHCAMGVSRSSTVVIAYRMKILNESLRDAFDCVKACREVISPNKGFFKVLENLEMESFGTSTMTFSDFYDVSKLKEDLSPFIEMGLISHEEIMVCVDDVNGDVVKAKGLLDVKISQRMDW
jgi:protein-tyrosine phosphatase